MSNPQERNHTINAFIPAAGFGERLRPITDSIPKPLLPLIGKPAIQYVIEKVSSLPVNTIGINLFHKKEMIRSWIASAQFNADIRLFEELSILGTGGALKNAETLLGERTFMVHNADIVSEMDMHAFLEYHRSSGNMVTLAVHDYAAYNVLEVAPDGQLCTVGTKGECSPSRAFTGIALYEPSFLTYLPEGKSSVVDAWLEALKDGKRIGVYDLSGDPVKGPPYWNDIGTPAAYASEVFKKLRDEGETVYVHPSVSVCPDVALKGQVVLEDGVDLSEGVTLNNCIMLPQSQAAEVLKSDEYTNSIVGPGFMMNLNESDIFSFKEGKQLIGTGGSDRKYYRVRKEGRSVVQMQCGDEDTEFSRHIEYTRFFEQQGIPVPALLSADVNRMTAEFEDAGDISLYSYLKCPREKSGIELLYRKVIDALVQFHVIPDADLAGCDLLRKRIFDHAYFRWETAYFMEHFVKGVRNHDIADLQMIENELVRLASRADALQKTVIHRDFQSQNIMVLPDGEMRVIDFQGARIGPPAYDLVSLLRDPYYRLSDDMRRALIDYYIERIKVHPERFHSELFGESLVICALQRHMQALGAYGYLSSVKGKKYFLKYVPEGMRLLREDAVAAREDYPALYELIMSIT